MFTEPLTLTVNSVAKVLNRIGNGQYMLRSATDEYLLNIRNSSYTDKKRGVLIDRHNVEFVHTVFPVAPATLSTVRKTYCVIENQRGDTLADPTYVASALFAWLTASANANILKLMNLES